MDPWEQGYAGEADEEQLPDADGLPSGDGWQGGWEAGGGGSEEEAEDEDLPDAAEGEPEEAAAAEAMGGSSEDGWAVEEEIEEQQQPAAVAPAVPVKPAAAAAVVAGQPAAAATAVAAAPPQRSSGRSVEVPQLQPAAQRPALTPTDGGPLPKRSLQQLSGTRQQQPQHQAVKQQATAAASVAATPENISTTSCTLGLADLGSTLPASAQLQQRLQSAAPPRSGRQQPGSSPTPGVVPLLEPLDPSLLDVAPTLAEVLLSGNQSSPVAAVTAAGTGVASVQHQQQLQVSQQRQHQPQQQAAPGHGQLRLRPAPAPAVPPARAAAAAGARTRAAAAVASVASIPDSDDDAPSFDLLDDVSPVRQQQGMAPAASPDEPFVYLLQLNRRAATAGGRHYAERWLRLG